jgi:hypothetical protein
MTPAQNRTRGKCTERAIANKVGGTHLGLLLGKEEVDAAKPHRARGVDVPS